MSKMIRRFLLGAGIILGLLVIVAIGIGMFFDLNRFKPQIEAAVSKSTGMQLKINGKASLRIFPQINVIFNNVHLINRGSELFAANEIRVTPQLGPFIFSREMVVNKIALIAPKIRVEKSRQGHMNYESTKTSDQDRAGTRPQESKINEIHRLSVNNGDLIYTDRGSGQTTHLTGISADILNISFRTGGPNPSALMKSVAFHGDIKADAVKSGSLSASKLNVAFRGDHGVLRLDTTEVSLLGGIVRGNALVDMREKSPKIQLKQAASHIDLSQTPGNVHGRVTGIADGDVSLSASGSNTQSLIKTTRGTLSIRSAGITLTGVNIDELASKLKTLQGLDFANIGNIFLGGLIAPPGNQAGVAGNNSGTKTVIQKLVSDWNIVNGVAEAKDVAFSTAKTKVACKGGINLVSNTFQNFHIATIDSQGCSKAKIEITGALNKPRPSTGSIGENISKSYLGQIVPAGCDHFYSGTLSSK